MSATHQRVTRSMDRAAEGANDRVTINQPRHGEGPDRGRGRGDGRGSGRGSRGRGEARGRGTGRNNDGRNDGHSDDGRGQQEEDATSELSNGETSDGVVGHGSDNEPFDHSGYNDSDAGHPRLKTIWEQFAGAARPVPFNLQNGQLLLEPVFWFCLFHERGLGWPDVEDSWKVPGPMPLGFRNALRGYVVGRRLKLDSWLESKMDEVTASVTKLARMYLRHDTELGTEEAQQSFLEEMLPEINEARDVINHLLWDVTKKAGGRAAATAFSQSIRFRDELYPGRLKGAVRAARSKALRAEPDREERGDQPRRKRFRHSRGRK